MLQFLKNLSKRSRPDCYDVVIVNRIENLVIFNLYDEGILCSSGMRLEESRFRHLLERLGITDYHIGCDLTEYSEAMKEIADKHDLVVLPNGGVISRARYDELKKGM